MINFKQFIENNDNTIVTEMVNVYWKKYSQLPSNFYFSTKQGKHGCRIKIQNDHGEHMNLNDTFIMSIPNGEIVEGKCKLTSKEQRYFERFVKCNAFIFLEFWNKHISKEEVMDKLNFDV